METCPGEGVVKKFPNTRKLSYWWVCGEFWNLRGQHNQETHTHTHTHTEYRLTTTPSEEEARMLAAATSERGLNREARVACLGFGPGLNTLRTI